ncbi:MAG: electron transport complex subunit RsxC, partial [Zetaproteobacteria bacterium]
MRWLDYLTGWWPNPFARGVRFRGGVRLAKLRPAIDVPIRPMPLPDCLIVPVKQHIGEPCEVVVRPGMRVRKGQTLARAVEYLAADIHAPTSGRITKIEDHRIPHPSGLGALCVFLEPDGEDEPACELAPLEDWRAASPEALRERIRRAGIVGLGGAAFPSFVKLARDPQAPEPMLILNGAECEPYLSNDARLMVECADEIVQGAQLIAHIVQARRIVVAIEDDKPAALRAMAQAARDAEGKTPIEVRAVPSVYPHGSEKQLIEALTGREVPAGKLPKDIGVVCHNVGTARAIWRAVVYGEPLIERVVTIAGDAVQQPGNWLVRIGTPVRFALAEAGVADLTEIEIVHGGPMMGERIPWPEVPTVKSTIGLLAFQKETFWQAHVPEEPCIRCGHCGQACPAGLAPNLLMEACRRGDVEEAERLALFDCIECGCCSYVCPAPIPVGHYFRGGKGLAAEVRRTRAFAAPR